MIRIAAALAASALFVAGAAYAGPDKTKKGKVIHVMQCPIMPKPAVKTGVPTRKLVTKSGSYMVHFCCPGCPGAFDKLTAAGKEQKVKAALKRSASATLAPKLVEVNTCPIMGGDSSHAGGGTSLVGNYKVNFCCGGCKPKFDSLPTADQQAKIKAALKS